MVKVGSSLEGEDARTCGGRKDIKKEGGGIKKTLSNLATRPPYLFTSLLRLGVKLGLIH